MNKNQQLRLSKALEMPVKFFLFDIDHNLTDDHGEVPEVVIKRMENIIKTKGSGIGFVSGRPEVATIPNGPDIMQVVNRLTENLSEEEKHKIVIYPEYAGYGRNIGTDELYEYGFISIFDQYKDQIIDLAKKRNMEYLDFLEIKKTGLSIWVKEKFRSIDIINKLVEDFSYCIVEKKIHKFFKVMNGANRTVDFTPINVNKLRSLQETATRFHIDIHEIATSDDQANKDGPGYDFTNHELGFATLYFYEKSDFQISTHLTLNKTGKDANLFLMKNLNFKAL